MLIVDKKIDGRIVSRTWTKKQMSLMSDDAKKKGKILSVHDIVSVQAEGDSLEYILIRFNNLPSCVSEEKMIWFGDIAKFIIGNWT